MKLCGIFLVACLVGASHATTAGRRFHIVFMENLVEAPIDNPLEVHVSNTGGLSAQVTVSSPLTSCGSNTVTVNADSSVKVNVCWWMRLVATDYWPTYKTVLVESTRDVMVYAYNKERFSADGFYVIPTDELGYDYYLATYDEANIATQFSVSATTDCSIQITLPPLDALPAEVNYRGMVYRNGEVFVITLTEYETYLGQSRGDLTGTRVLSDQPIAVFSGNIRNKANSGSRDHLAAQLQPTGDWGTQYAVAPVPRSENFGDILRVIAMRQNTAITIRFSQSSNQIRQTIANPGGYYEITITAACVVVADNTNKPVQVIQMVRSQAAARISDVADPVVFLAVTRNQWLNEYISPSLTYKDTGASYDRNMAFIAITDGQESGLRVDGGSISPSWTRINGIASTWLSVSGGSHRFSHTSNQGFGVMVYGASDRESYGFALGADLSNSGCQESLPKRGDGLDNDCDGSVDEEPCNGLDDDGDGQIDEDCPVGSIEAFGNEYVIMFMENNVDDNPNAQSFLEIYLSAVDTTATVQYTLSSEIDTVTNTIQPGQVEIFTDLPNSLRQTGSGVDTKAIRITADADIVVYGINKQTFSTDGFLAFPVDVVGNEYYTSHYYPGSDLNEFAFTPVFNDSGVTTVTVTMPTISTNGSSANFGNQRLNAGESTVVTLRYGQTAQFQATGNDQNLNGARIVSDKPISAFSGNVRARVDPTTANSRDHLVHQLAPVSTWGLEFVTVPIPRQSDRGDIFFITASVDNTVIKINFKNTDGTANSQPDKTLAKAGDYVQVNIGSTQYGHFTSNRPVQVFQYVKTTANRFTDEADPAMMLVPPVQQWSRNYRFITPQTGQADGNGGFVPFNSFVMIAIESSQRNGLRLDGNPLANPTWIELTGTTYAATVVNIPGIGRHTLTHPNSEVFFQALMYGRADRESFALPLGMKLVAQGCVQTTPRDGDGIDNDCDGTADEELCNSIDDDADGQVDEDCGSGLASGTSFFLTYMENTVEYPQDLDLELYIAAVGNQKSTVTVRTPLYSQPAYDILSEVKAKQVQKYGLSYRLKNNGQGVFNNTVFVRANADVVVYGVNKEKFSNDAFLVYPESSLGTEYYTCSWSPSTLPTEFAVVATQDNTQVTITLPSGRSNLQVEANNQIYTGGDSFTVNLARFQTYQAQSSGDLTGTRVVSNIRTAVFSGNVRTRVELSGSRDHLVQQMLPTPSYGERFYVIPFPARTVGDVLKIIGRTGGTDVLVNGGRVGTINRAGDFVQYNLNSNNRVTLTATNPVMVVQFVKSQDGRNNPEEADPAMFVVPSESNFITTATFVTPVYSGGRNPDADYINYVTLVIQNGQQGNVRLNGDALSSPEWNGVTNSGYVTTNVMVSSGMSHTITTTSGASFYGRLYGRADRESYAFPIGFSF